METSLLAEPQALTADGYFVKVNFQTATAATPAGYAADVGQAYADRGNGFAYGWDVAATRSARNRGSTLSPDERYDTLIHTQSSTYPNRTWELAVPNGTYAVRVVAGDPISSQGTYKFNVEGMLTVDGKPTDAGRWVEGTRDVTVADGRLTVSNAVGSWNNKLSFLEVKPAGPEPAPAAGPFAWAARAAAPQPLYEAQGAAVGGKLYVFGGYVNTSNVGSLQTYVYDPVGNAWKRLADAPAALTHAGVAVDGATVWLGGGFVGDNRGPSTEKVWKYNTATNAWSPGPDLPEQRGSGALVRVGRELHFFGGSVRAAGTLVFDDRPDHWVLNLDGGTGWVSKAAFPNPRNHLGGVELNGKVYAVGGQHAKDEANGNERAVDVYDPAADRWTPAADLPKPVGHIAASVFTLGGRIVVVGGLTNETNDSKKIADVSAYDPATNRWAALTPIPGARQSPVADVIGNQVVVTTGSSGGATRANTWVGVFENHWESAARAPIALGEVAGGIVGGNMYVVGEGGDATLAYDLAAGTWGNPTALAPRPFKGGRHAAEVYNGKLYLFGGIGGSSEGKVQIYNPATNSWSTGRSMPFAAGASSSALINGQIYVTGGIVGSSTTNRLASYDPAKNTWTNLANMPQGRDHAAAATDGGRLYVFGGRGPGSGDANTVANGFDTVQIYNPATNSWVSSATPGSTLAPLPQARGGAGKAVYADGRFYVLGGETGTGGGGATADKVYRRVDVYNPLANTWRAGSPMRTARHGVYPLLHAGRVYVAGGGTRVGASTSSLLEILNLPYA